jgi:flagellar biosynthetic protein FliR
VSVSAVSDAAGLGAAWLLAAARVGPVVALVPPFGGQPVPLAVRVGVAAVLAAVVAPLVPGFSVAQALPGAAPELAALLVAELAVGLVFGACGLILVEAVRMAGAILDDTLGGVWSSAGGSDAELPLATLHRLLFAAIFVAVGGHRALVTALAGSYERLPLGLGGMGATGFAAWVEVVAVQLGISMLLAVAVAVPVVAALLLTELALALLARASRPARAGIDALTPRTVALIVALALGLAASASLWIGEITRLEQL